MIEIELGSARMICDFCSAENPTRKYDCASFIMAETKDMVHRSDNAWAACATCAALIDADEWERLIQRVIMALPWEMRAARIDDYREYLRKTYKLLRAAKEQTA